jgi:hypothetical protein
MEVHEFIAVAEKILNDPTCKHKQWDKEVIDEFTSDMEVIEDFCVMFYENRKLQRPFKDIELALHGAVITVKDHLK